MLWKETDQRGGQKSVSAAASTNWASLDFVGLSSTKDQTLFNWVYHIFPDSTCPVPSAAVNSSFGSSESARKASLPSPSACCLEIKSMFSSQYPSVLCHFPLHLLCLSADFPYLRGTNWSSHPSLHVSTLSPTFLSQNADISLHKHLVIQLDKEIKSKCPKRVFQLEDTEAMPSPPATSVPLPQATLQSQAALPPTPRVFVSQSHGTYLGLGPYLSKSKMSPL